ncbi:MAG: hypothetical protein M3Y91_19140 [Actinomycetota bacterium]|nr:hypothetical protein [Actinomycetota bacterium]
MKAHRPPLDWNHQDRLALRGAAAAVDDDDRQVVASAPVDIGSATSGAIPCGQLPGYVVSRWNRQASEGRTVARYIGEFTPDMPERYWAVIEAFVRAAVADAQPRTPYRVRDLLTPTARHVLWCWQTAGLPLQREVIFDRHVIEEFAAHGSPTWSPATTGNHRSQLLRMAEALNPKAQPARLTPFPSADPVRPYSPSEMTALRSWTTGQNTPTRRRDASVLLALGAGAGLAVEDIAGLTAAMVTVDDDGVLLAVPGRRARVVPVLAAWEAEIIGAVEVVPADRFLFCANRTVTGKNYLGSFVRKSTGVEIKPLVQRLRATWIVGHLAARTPVVPLMAAAGVESLEALTRYLRFVPGIEAAEARRALRGQLGQLSQLRGGRAE